MGKGTLCPRHYKPFSTIFAESFFVDIWAQTLYGICNSTSHVLNSLCRMTSFWCFSCSCQTASLFYIKRNFFALPSLKLFFTTGIAQWFLCKKTTTAAQSC